MVRPPAGSPRSFTRKAASAGIAIALVTGGTLFVPQAAFAADPLPVTKLYGTSSGTRDIFEIDPRTGQSVRLATAPASAAGTSLNQIGVTADGKKILVTNPSRIYEYTLATQTWEETSRTGDGLAGVSGGNTMGGVSTSNDWLYYGGQASGNTFRYSGYNPANNAVVPNVLTVTLPGAPGNNGDLAFDKAGDMFIVVGGDTTAQIYRVDGPPPTASGATATGTPVGPLINNAQVVNSMAFGSDGYLYLYGGNGFMKVNPTTGAVVSRIAITGATGNLIDLGSWAAPVTAELNVNLPQGRAKAGDQFGTRISGGGISTGNTGTTAGGEEGLQDQSKSEYVGPLIGLPGESYTITQTAANGTDLNDYSTTWQCIDASNNDAVVSSGTGNSGTFTIPSDFPGSSVVCTFTNIPKPVAADDSSLDNPQGSAVTVPVLGNDKGDVDPTTVNLLDPDGKPVKELKVPGEGTWTVNPDTGDVTFTPEEGFEGNPTPVDYQVSDKEGNTTKAKVTVTYKPEATNDRSDGNTLGSAVKVPVLANDKGDLDPTTVNLLDPDGKPVKELTVPGEGKWTVDPETGDVTFTPEEGFEGNPTPVKYEVTDKSGKTAQAEVAVTYTPEASDDRSDHNTIGSAVKVPTLGNDKGDLDPKSVEILDSEGKPVKELAVPGEGKWTVDPETGDVTFTPEEGFTGNPTPVDYQVSDKAGNTAKAKVIVTYDPQATDDRSDGNKIGSAVEVPILDNDKGELDPKSVNLLDPDGKPVKELDVPGQGKWTVNPDTGKLTFTPEEGFTGNPTPVDYRVSDTNGNTTKAKVTVTYTPEASDDRSDHNKLGSAVKVPTLGNDKGDLDPTSVSLLGPEGKPVKELAVPGEGTWTVDPETGDVTFTPEEGFTGNPTPVKYEVKDKNGKSAQATVTVTYDPEASPDRSDHNKAGSAVKVPVLGNDKGDLDPTTVGILDPDGKPVKELKVPGEGTWTVDPKTGDITFTPEEGFTGNPTPVKYEVKDKNGNATQSDVTVTYDPEATDDLSENNPVGSAVKVPVLGNDKGDLDPKSVEILDPDGKPVKELKVPGEGTWTVNPDTGDVTFTPEEGFEGNPTPVDYQVSDKEGNTTTAKVTVTYSPEAADDRSDDNTIGSAVKVPVLGNDKGDLDPKSVGILDPDGKPVKELTVPGEGKWTVDPETGDVTFTPEEGFTKNPTPVKYEVTDKSGKTAQATVTVTYKPEAANDESLNNKQGTAVTVPALKNDRGELDPKSVGLLDPDGKPVKELKVPGEGTWTVNPDTGDVTFTPEEGFTKNPTPVKYEVADKNGKTAQATVTVTYKPEAADDESLNNAQGSAVKVPVLGNDKGDLDPTTVKLKDKDGNPVSELTVPGEGKWTVNPENGDITFTPEDGFKGNPTPIDYTVKDRAGNETGAKVTVTYVEAPVASDDESLNNPQGTAVKVPVLGNDKGDLDPSTVKLKDKDGNPVDSLTVPGEGKWTVDPATGDVTFTPEEGFTKNPTPVDYTVKDKNGQETGAKVTVTYKPEATDDESLNNKQGTAVTVPTLKNDKGDLDPTTVKLKDKDGNPVDSLTVPGEGKWTVNPDNGDVTFTPEDGFKGNPTPIDYTVKDKAGNGTGAKVTVTYTPEAPAPKAEDDQSLNNAQGTAVKVPVLGNDKGDFDPSTVKLKDKDGNPVSELTVPGEGKWTVDPKSGDVTFTPEDGFKGNPTPVDYTVKDKNGNETGAKITVTYTPETPKAPQAKDDQSLNNKPGTAVTVPVVGNDEGDLDPTTVKIIDPGTGNPVDKLVVPGEGNWTIDPKTGDVTFTPEDGFKGNPTPVNYTVKDKNGQETRAKVTITYQSATPTTPAPGTPETPAPGTSAPTQAPTPPATAEPGDDLASTGANLPLWLPAGGLAAAVLGAVVLLVSRRRKSH